jgi:adenylosuccinate synthase
MFGPVARCVVVVGAQWGDEGKGKIVDIMSQHADLVVRYQGGANAGHTVVCGKEQFILHLVPSGILHQSALCLIANGVVLDPNTLMEELEALEQRGTEVEGRLLISDRAHLVLPYHVLLDRARERTGNIGTTGRGIGPAYEDKYGRRGIRVGDLRDGNRLQELVRSNVERANRLCEMLDFSERADLADHVRILERVRPRLLPLIADTGFLIHEAIKARRNVLLEGAQGTLLDVDHGTYPFVTSSNTTAGGAGTGSGIGPTSIEAVVGVVKAYTTRVGNGPLPTEAKDDVGRRLRELGGEYGATTGRPRRCGWFDAVVASYAARVNGITQLAVTKLDVLDTVPSVPICVGYELDGERMLSFPADIASLDRIEPVYQEMEGWVTSTGDARRPDDLPRQARAYLDRIAEMIGAPIEYVSVGSRRDQVIQFN